MSGARSSIMLAARNAGSIVSSGFATGSWTSRSVMIHISPRKTDRYHFKPTPISRQFQRRPALRKMPSGTSSIDGFAGAKIARRPRPEGRALHHGDAVDFDIERPGPFRNAD